MIRLLVIPVAVAALAVSAAPASAKMHLDDISLGASASSGVYLGKTLTGKAKIIDGRFP